MGLLLFYIMIQWEMPLHAAILYRIPNGDGNQHSPIPPPKLGMLTCSNL